MANQTLFDGAESQRRAEAGQERVGQKNPAAIAKIQAAFIEHLKHIAPAPGSLDTLRQSGFEPPPTSHRNAVGAAIAAMSRAGTIECVGVVRGRRPVAHAGKQFLWRIAGGGKS